MKKITILVPVYNEESTLDSFYVALKPLVDNKMTGGREYEWEVLFVNDGSRDNSLEKIKCLRNADSRISYVSLSRNFGKESAMLAGIDYASGDCVVIMDADLQDPIEVVPQMIEAWEDGWDDVYGKRRTRGKEPLLRKLFTKAFYNLLQKSTNIEMLPNVGDFRLLDRRCVDALKRLRETQRYTKGLFCWIGYRKKEILFDRANRDAGKSSFNFFKLLNLGIEGITGFTTTPLRISTIVGFIVSLVAFVYMVVMITKTLIWGEPIQGYPSLMCVILFLGGCQLIAIGIIGEYIGRIFNETKSRPPYIADIHNGTKIK